MSDNEHREQLETYLTGLIEGHAWADTGREAVEHIATVLGWRPPSRLITSSADLDALPDDTIIRTRYGTAAQKVDEAWEVPNEVGRCLSGAIGLPATVLYLPEEARA